MRICVDVCLCAVWTRPQSSIESILIGLGCLTVWTPKSMCTNLGWKTLCSSTDTRDSACTIKSTKSTNVVLMKNTIWMHLCAHDQKLNHRCEHTIMVCSHFPTWMPIQIPINYGMHRIVRRRHGAQRQSPSQIHIGFCSNVIGICISLGLGVIQCKRTIGPTHIFS